RRADVTTVNRRSGVRIGPRRSGRECQQKKMTEGVSSAPNASTDNALPRSRNADSDSAASLPSSEIPPLDATAGTPDEIWSDYFSKRSPDAETVHQLVAKLNEEGKHDHVVAVIRAALRNGQGQPWMYEVLVLSLKIQGAQQAE